MGGNDLQKSCMAVVSTIEFQMGDTLQDNRIRHLIRSILACMHVLIMQYLASLHGHWPMPYKGQQEFAVPCMAAAACMQKNADHDDPMVFLHSHEFDLRLLKDDLPVLTCGSSSYMGVHPKTPCSMCCAMPTIYIHVM